MVEPYINKLKRGGCGINFSKLISHLQPYCVSDKPDEILEEWNHWTTWEEKGGVCRCGKKGIRFRASIKHKESGCIIDPIGSSCINYFPAQLQTDYRQSIKDYLEEKRERIASTPLGWGEYKHLTPFKIGIEHPDTAQWYLTRTKLTTDIHSKYWHMDNDIIKEQLKKGIKNGIKETPLIEEYNDTFG